MNFLRPASCRLHSIMICLRYRRLMTTIWKTEHINSSKARPMYPFGYGLSYGKIEYYDINISNEKISAE